MIKLMIELMIIRNDLVKSLSGRHQACPGMSLSGNESQGPDVVPAHGRNQNSK